MKYFLKLSLNLILFFITILSNGQDGSFQNGFIRGAVYDNTNGETLPGVTILIQDTYNGTITDLDGKFSINVEPGIYNLRISFISYETIILEDIEVKSNGVTILDNISLKESITEINEVIITSSTIRNTENSIVAIKKKSPNLLDGISSENLRRTGDSNLASSVKRIPGISVEGGKYVFVRGLGDRYTKTILNGVDIPGLDPDRNSIQMDIFPTNVIDNVLVNKSFNAELPADFTGGVINIETKDFPITKKGNLNFGIGYSPNYHFRSDFLTYQGGKTDFFGFDDGTRNIPATDNIPFFSEIIGDINGEKSLRYQEILNSFNPNLSAYQQRNFMNYNFGAYFGDQISGEKLSIGYNLSLSYKNSSEFYKDAEYGKYGLSGNPDIMEMETREFQIGDYGVKNVLISGLGGFSIKNRNSKVKLNLLHLQNGESTAGIFDFESTDQGTIFSGFQHNLNYNQRSLSNILLSGKHNIEKYEIEWKVSPTFANMYDPDTRFTRYVVSNDKYIIGTESGFPERIWRNLNEFNIVNKFNIKKEFDFNGKKSNFNFGALYTYKERDFDILSYALNIRNINLTGDPNEILNSENIWPINGDISRGTGFEARFIPISPNKFNSNSNLVAGYISTEINTFQNFKSIIGLRTEYYIQRYTGQDQLGKNILNNDEVLKDLSFFPSINLIYNFKEEQNLRFSFSKTIARPSFKELSYAEIFDPITGSTFIGGMFRDANDVKGIEYWNGKLINTDIFNFDLRWENFNKVGQFISAGIFYKSFKNPIEIVQYFTQAGSFQPRNVGDAQVFGGEVEIKQNLDFISMSNYSLIGNVTYVKSKVKLSETEYISRLNNARYGQEISKYREMSGQSPFVVNLGILYDGKIGFFKDFETALFYNVQSRTLQYIGIADRPDIYMEPFHSLNLTSSKSINNWNFYFKVKNLLCDNKESIYVSYMSNDKYFSKIKSGTIFNLGVIYNIF